jgi:hypothetical protein
MICSRPPEISVQALFAPLRVRFWSTYASCTVSPIFSSPSSAVSLPTIILNSVVLPAPLGPIMPTMPPRGSENDSPSKRSLSP